MLIFPSVINHTDIGQIAQVKPCKNSVQDNNELLRQKVDPILCIKEKCWEETVARNTFFFFLKEDSTAIRYSILSWPHLYYFSRPTP